MHVKNPILFGLMAILLLAGTITPGISQSAADTKVVINEVEINPYGSDAGLGVGGSGNQSKEAEGTSGSQEYIELYNPTLQSIDLSGWSLVPSASWKTLQIPSNTIIEPESFLVFTHVNFWFNDFGETISLFDNDDQLIDKTHVLVDKDDTSSSWQRIYDGVDTDSDSDWTFKTMNPKSSNGKFVATQEESFSFTGKTDKTTYRSGESVKISGSVSELLYKPNSGIAELIKVNIAGPNYYKNIALYPNHSNDYFTTLNLQKVLGFELGTYKVNISYGSHSITTEFIISDEQLTESSENLAETIEILTDQQSYIPGDLVTLLASTNSSIEFGGLEYVVKNPYGKIVAEGTIFPNSEFSTVYAAGGGQIYPFSTQFIVGTINPVYGTYEIEGVYKAQNPFSASKQLATTASYEVVEDVKEDVAISLSTDKTLYEIGEIVQISGRSNHIWTEDVELRIIQTGFINKSLGGDSSYQALSPLDEKYSIKLNGDGTFEYYFKIPGNSDPLLTYGDYLIKVSEYFGESSVKIKVVEDPASFVDVRTPLGLQTDKSKYVLGTSINISGSISNYRQTATNNFNDFVTITFKDPNGRPLVSEDRGVATNDYGKAPNAPLEFTAVPDAVGNFKVSAILNLLQFDYGTYSLTAFHQQSNTSETVVFDIISAQSEILSPTETQEPLIFELCTSVKPDIDDILKDLRKTGKGEIPPSMESVTCDGSTDYNTGEKLVVTGKVALKDSRSLTSTSANPSGNTQEGHSYSTNYAHAQMNYVELSIPYPQSLTISTSYRTIPDAGEDYHGGGGAGGGGITSGDGSSGIGTGTGGLDSGRETSSNRHTGYDGQAILREVTKFLTDMKVKAYPGSEGNFAAVFDLRAGVFKDGIYTLKADYFGYKAEETFSVQDDSLKGGAPPEIVVSTPKNEYIQGEVVEISGQIKNVYYYDNVTVKVETPDVSTISCLEGQNCGLGNSIKKIRVSEGTNGAQFFMNYKIPSSANFGEHTIIAETHFGTVKKSFYVINELDSVSTPETDPSQTPLTKKSIEKFNRISESQIPITLTEKSVDENTLSPRVISGSLFTSARGEESDVNLRITTSGGQCVVGQSSDCLVTESTRKPGAIYSIVSIDDVDYKIRYSGNDVRLEKFSIVPVESSSKIDINNWNVEIIKDEQPSRFYYKVSYVALE